MNKIQQAKARRKAIHWARTTLKRGAIIVDFETTGLHDAEIIQIGIINTDGDVLMDQMVKPRKRISKESIAIHGITPEMVADSPSFVQVAPTFARIIKAHDVVAYNVSYESDVLHRECRRHAIDEIQPLSWSCAMRHYASFYGQWNPRRRNFVWQNLRKASQQQMLEVKDAHNAVGDCRMTLALIHKMAEATIEVETPDALVDKKA